MQRREVAFALILLGVGLRLAAICLGENNDVRAYRFVADQMFAGDDIYASGRYNHAPGWAWIAYGIRWVTAGDDGWFRIVLVLFLTLGDLGITSILRRGYGVWVAVAFWLNPVSILVTGMHCSFDNVAVWFGLIAGGYGLLGWCGWMSASLVVKHVGMFHAANVFFKERGIRRCAAFLPAVVFLASFLPYLPGSLDGIDAHVFRYRSFRNAPMWQLVVPASCRGWFPSAFVVWVVGMAVVGWCNRGRDGVSAFLRYTGWFVFLSPAMANQYLTIPVAYVCTMRNFGAVAYVIVAAAHLIGEEAGLISWTDANYVMSLGMLGVAMVMSDCRMFGSGTSR